MIFSNPRPNNLMQDVLMFKLEELDTHILYSHNLLNKQIASLESQRPKKIHSEEDFDYDCSLSSAIFDFASTSQTIYHGFIVSYYSFLEHFLVDLCNHLRVKQKFTLKVEDIQAKGHVNQAKKYLEKVFEFQFEGNIKKQWDEINDLKHIRNAIIHQLSSIYKNKDHKSSIEQSQYRLLKILSDNSDCALDLESGSFTLNFEFVKQTGVLIEKFLLELTEKLCEND